MIIFVLASSVILKQLGDWTNNRWGNWWCFRLWYRVEGKFLENILFDLSVVDQVLVVVCAELPPVVYHAFAFKLKKVKFSETLFKLFNLKVTVFVTIKIFNGPPNKVPIICILVDQLGQEFPVDLNKSLYFVV